MNLFDIIKSIAGLKKKAEEVDSIIDDLTLQKMRRDNKLDDLQEGEE